MPCNRRPLVVEVSTRTSIIGLQLALDAAIVKRNLQVAHKQHGLHEAGRVANGGAAASAPRCVHSQPVERVTRLRVRAALLVAAPLRPSRWDCRAEQL
jgi:hypothetical protein